jgi:CheY-like chemotaxis protein
VGAKRILIVDGDADTRTVYRTMLQHSGYDVVEVEDGEAAVRHVAEQPVDAVVMELTLRLVDGHTLLKRLRSDERTRDVCAIVITARPLEDDRRLAELAGCQRFLVKPVAPQELLHEVRALVS